MGKSSRAEACEVSQLILAASADGIVAVDEQGTIRFINRAAQDLLGRPEDELAGAPFWLPIAAGRTIEVEVGEPGGDRVLELRPASTELAGERLHVVSLREVTHRKAAERELHAALDRQNSALAMAAHELRSPLAAISVLTYVLADDKVVMAPAERARVADRVAELTSRLQALVQRLLTSARLDAGEARAVPAQVRVLEVITDQLALSGTDHGAVKVACSPRLAALVDRAELAMMLANYLDNALIHARPPIEIRAAQRAGWAEIQVIDHGPGVPDSFAPLLFERFTRAPGTQRHAEGTGLGLWIVRTLAQANSGAAWYEPVKGGGARFLIRLPTRATGPR